MKRQCLIVFVKSPEKEGVKSRLAATVGEQKARRLYRCFVEDLLEALDKRNYGLKIFFYPPNDHPVLSRWLGGDRAYEPQIGEDLGQRMKNAFEACFADGFETAILIGSDSPDMTREIIDKGFVALTSYDAVIGPSLDGGYYLIGFKSETFLPDLFTDIPWSKGGVLKSTLAIADRKGLRVSLLPPWRDIDTHEDLKALIERHRHTSFARSRTVRCALSGNGSE
jgi:uncharacterized protein